jgi:hypothetical protein
MDPIDDEKVKKFYENKRKDWQMINELCNNFVISNDVVQSLRGSTGDILKNRIAFIMQTAKKRKDVPNEYKKKNGTNRKNSSEAVPQKSLKYVAANAATSPKKKNQLVHTGTNTRISQKSGAVAHRNVAEQVTPPSNLGEIDKAVANQNVAAQVAPPSNLGEIDKAVANQNVAAQVAPPSNLDEMDKAVANQNVQVTQEQTNGDNTLDSSQGGNDSLEFIYHYRNQWDKYHDLLDKIIKDIKTNEALLED